MLSVQQYNNDRTNFGAFNKTFAMIKPKAVKDGHAGEIISMIEKNKDLKIDKLEMTTLDKLTAQKHYAEHKGKSFYQELIDFITSGPVIKMEISGDEAISKVRALSKAIREKFATSITANAIHTSDGVESAARELALHFDKTI